MPGTLGRPISLLKNHSRSETMACRWYFTLIVATGLACGALTMAAAPAQDKGDSQPDPGSPRGRDAGAEDTAQRIDKAIRAYQDRAARDLEQTRKELDRMRKELGELTELRLDMAIAAAE